MSVLLVASTQLILFILGLLGPWQDASARETQGRLPVQARMLISFSLVIAAWLIWLGNLGKVSVYGQWVALGMSASFVGDLIMARLIPVPNRLIGGMIAFGVAHGLYITAYTRAIQTISALAPYERFNTGVVVGLVVYGAITLVGWWFLIRNPQKGTVINIGALVYGLWISVMASFALGLANALGFWFTALGGLLFVTSDFLIGVSDIRGIQLKNANEWVWLTYLAGQMGIIYAGTIVR